MRMTDNMRWAVVDRQGRLWPWTLSWNRKTAITAAAKFEMKRLEITRKSARARVKRDRGCRVLKVVITEAINGD